MGVCTSKAKLDAQVKPGATPVKAAQQEPPRLATGEDSKVDPESCEAPAASEAAALGLAAAAAPACAPCGVEEAPVGGALAEARPEDGDDEPSE